jgi:hypothetical protein
VLDPRFVEEPRDELGISRQVVMEALHGHRAREGPCADDAAEMHGGKSAMRDLAEDLEAADGPHWRRRQSHLTTLPWIVALQQSASLFGRPGRGKDIAVQGHIMDGAPDRQSAGRSIADGELLRARQGELRTLAGWYDPGRIGRDGRSVDEQMRSLLSVGVDPDVEDSALCTRRKVPPSPDGSAIPEELDRAGVGQRDRERRWFATARWTDVKQARRIGRAADLIELRDDFDDEPPVPTRSASMSRLPCSNRLAASVAPCASALPAASTAASHAGTHRRRTLRI